jgi:hypothetical protein
MLAKELVYPICDIACGMGYQTDVFNPEFARIGYCFR